MNNSELSERFYLLKIILIIKKLADYVNTDILQRNIDHSTYLRDTEKVIGDNQNYLNTQVNTTPPKRFVIFKVR